MEEHLRSGNTGIRHHSDVVPDTQEQGGTECCDASSVLRACVHPRRSGPSTSRGKKTVKYCVRAGDGEAVLLMSAPVDEVLITSCQREAFDFLVWKLKV